MSRLRRLEFHGAIHLIRIRGRVGDNIFFDTAALRGGPLGLAVGWPVSLRHFAELAWRIFADSGASVHAYAMDPDSVVLVIQTFGAPLHAIMRRVCGEYSRYLHQEHGFPAGRTVFAARYESRVIAPNYLPHAIRRVHRSPFDARAASSHADYPFSSDAVYGGAKDSVVPVETTMARRLLAQRRFVGAAGYRRFTSMRESKHVAGLFDRGSPLDSRIVGDRGYVATVKALMKRPRATPSVDQLLQTVAVMISRSPEEIRSHRSGALGRALVAWYATRIGTARSLAEVGRWFSVTGATLGVAIRNYHDDDRYRPLFSRRPDLLFAPDEGHP